jgi:hypothetical protein
MLPTTDHSARDHFDHPDHPAQGLGTSSPEGAVPREAPPTSPGLLGRAHIEPSWPAVLGIMCLVYGILITIVAGFSLAAPFMMNAFARLMAPESAAMMGMMQPQHIIVINSIYYVPALFINAWLAVLGLRLHHKLPAAPARMRLWSFIKIGLELMCGAITFVVTLEVMRHQNEFITQQMSTAPGAPPPPTFMASNWFVYSSASLGALWSLFLGLALPIFLLIWFRRRSVRDYVATWSSNPAALQA